MTGQLLACPTCDSPNSPGRIRCTDVWHGEKIKPDIPSWLIGLLRFAEREGASEVLDAVPAHIRREAGRSDVTTRL